VAIAATVAVKFPVVAPANTVTLPGTVAFALLLDSATASPPPGAALLNVTVQMEDPGAFTLDGAQERPLRPPGITDAVRLTVVALLCPFQVTVTVAVWPLLTAPAVAVNVPLLELVPIVIPTGTANAAILLDRLTVAVVAGALVSITVQVAACAVPNVLGEQLTEDNCAGATIPKENVREVLLAVAMIVAV